MINKVEGSPVGVNNLIRSLIKANKITIGEMADRIGITRVALSKKLNMSSGFTTLDAEKIFAELGLKMTLVFKTSEAESIDKGARMGLVVIPVTEKNKDRGYLNAIAQAITMQEQSADIESPLDKIKRLRDEANKKTT